MLSSRTIANFMVQTPKCLSIIECQRSFWATSLCTCVEILQRDSFLLCVLPKAKCSSSSIRCFFSNILFKFVQDQINLLYLVQINLMDSILLSHRTFRNRVSCSPDWSWPICRAKDDLELQILLLPSQMLRITHSEIVALLALHSLQL